MTQQYDERSTGGAEPAWSDEEAVLAARLERDGGAWRRQVPANDRLNAWVRALPDEHPRSAPPDGTWHPETQVEWIFDESDLTREAVGVAQGATRRSAAWAAGVAALLVVGLIAALLLGARVVTLQPGGLGPAQATTTCPPATSVTRTPPTYAPASQYIACVMTAMGVTAANQPLEQTSQFTRNDAVYLLVQVQHVPTGQHTLTIRWSLNGAGVPPACKDVASIVVPSPSGTVWFRCVYQVDGTGTAKLYWDLPANTADAQADARLVGEVAFVVNPVGSPATPTVLPNGAGAAPPTPSPLRTP